MLSIVRNLRTRLTHLTTLHPTLIGRVNKLMTNNIRSTYNCHTFLESSGQVHQTIYRVNIWGSLTLYPNIGLIWCRVKKLMTNNIRSTYNCHTFLESSGQSIKPYISRVNICRNLYFAPIYRINLV